MSNKHCPWHEHRVSTCAMCDLANDSNIAQEIAQEMKERTAPEREITVPNYNLKLPKGRMVVVAKFGPGEEIIIPKKFDSYAVIGDSVTYFKMAPILSFKKKYMLNEVRYELSDNDGRAVVLSLYPFTNRNSFARDLREAKAMIQQRVGFFK